MRWAAVVGLTLFAVVVGTAASATTIVVPDDQPSIQVALAAAAPGDTVQVKTGVYSEQIDFPNSGAPGAYISLEAFPGHTPVLDGTAFDGRNAPLMVSIADRSYVKVIGFEIRNLTRVRDGSGIRIVGSGSHIELRNNRIHNIRGKDAMGITVYGTEATSISDLIIDGNEIYDCDPAKSETLTLNGNIEQFQVTNNVVRDVNNIGIDAIGGETDIQPDQSLVARNGVIRGNRVERANSVYGDGFAGGIYIDGGKDIVLEQNVVTGSDLGIEVGSENAGVVSTGIIVRDNLMYANDKACIAFGGYATYAGRVNDSFFLNNTCYGNDTVRSGFGELWIQYGTNNAVRNNIFHAGPGNQLLVSEVASPGNTLDYNLWYAPAGAGASRFTWQGTEYASFAAYRAGSSQDASSSFAEAQFFAPSAADFHLGVGSPAIDAGDPGFVAAPGETDRDGAPRVNAGRVDAGADEQTCGDGVIDAGESCDDANHIDCDGCDSNCTPTATCGNRIVCGAEQCDDGNAVDGDCCSSSCLAQLFGDACDDGDLCTRLDQCDGAGACIGSATPEPICHGPTVEGNAAIRVIDSHLGNKRDALLWRLSKGESAAPSEYGDPSVGTDYALCAYDASASPQPVLHFSLPAGGQCNERPLWRVLSNGYRFTNRCVTANGIFSATLLRDGSGLANIRVQGRRERLHMPPLGLAAPVTVQLRNDAGGCWAATFATPTSNTAEIFKATVD